MKYLLLTLLVSGALFAQSKRPVDEGMTDQGPVRLTIINHASFVIEQPGQVIYVDPVGANRYEGLPQPDLILITHTHGDHMDPATVAKLRKAGTQILGPETVAKSVPGTTVIRNGETRQIGPTTIEAVPAYNFKRGPSPGSFLPPERGGQRLRPDLHRPARLYRRRHRSDPGDESSQEHRGGLPSDEPAFHHDAGGGRRGCPFVQPADRLSVPLPRLRHCGLAEGARRRRDSSPNPRLVLLTRALLSFRPIVRVEIARIEQAAQFQVAHGGQHGSP